MDVVVPANIAVTGTSAFPPPPAPEEPPPQEEQDVTIGFVKVTPEIPGNCPGEASTPPDPPPPLPPPLPLPPPPSLPSPACSTLPSTSLGRRSRELLHPLLLSLPPPPRIITFCSLVVLPESPSLPPLALPLRPPMMATVRVLDAGMPDSAVGNNKKNKTSGWNGGEEENTFCQLSGRHHRICSQEQNAFLSVVALARRHSHQMVISPLY